MPFFRHEGSRLAYTIYGDGPRTFVLVHGLLLSQKMHRPLAGALAARGNRVVTLDLLGHGRSDRPQDMTRYSMPFFGEQMITLLDHLEIEEAVLGGTSLGANATLEAAVHAPERVRGMVVEMPVLDNALLGCAIAFTPLMIALTFGERAMRLVARGARMVPSGVGPLLADVGLDTIRQDPGPSAAVGHARDPIHPFSDSDALLAELPNARLLQASSILELRLSPERLTGEIGDFLDTCWKARRRGGASRARRVA